MLYINNNDIKKINLDWGKLINVIEKASVCLNENDSKGRMYVLTETGKTVLNILQ